MNCPKCNSSSHNKNGIVGGRQRYKCHDCGYNYALEGLGFRSIGRVLGVSHVSVQK